MLYFCFYVKYSWNDFFCDFSGRQTCGLLQQESIATYLPIVNMLSSLTKDLESWKKKHEIFDN